MRSVLLIFLGFFANGAFALNYADSALLGPGNKNYIKNAGAEQSRAGWATYADAAGTSPVDCTGGSPSATWTTSATTPLSGQYSFIWTHPSSNRQGDGVAYAFTIDKSDQARQMSVSFDYEVASGTFTAGVVPIGGATAVDSDLEVYVYDVTNAVMIQPSNFRLLGGAGNQQRFTGTFQTAANSTSYRLCLHAATTTTTAHTLRIDSVKVGPQVMTTGPPVSDWTTYAPTVTNGPGTSGSFSGWWRRSGDSMEIRLLAPTITGSGSASSMTISIPSGYTIDTTKTNTGSGSDFGTATRVTSAPVVHNYNVFYQTSSSVGLTEQSGTASLKGSDWSAGDAFSAYFLVPIVGWASNVSVGGTDDGRVLAFYVSPSAPTGTLTSSYNTASWGSASVDTHGAWNGTNTYTFPIGGYFNLSAAVSLTDGSASSAFEGIQFLVNGTTAIGQSVIRNSATASHSVTTALNGYHFNAGDTVVAQVQSAAGSPAFNTATGVHWFSISKAPGPAQLAAADTVAAKYNSTASTSITSSAATLPWGNKEYDTTGSMNGGTGVYTVPIPGKYRVTFQFKSASVSLTTTQFAQAFIRQNSSAKAQQFVLGNGASNNWNAAVTTELSCVAGDTIDAQAQISSSSTLSGEATANFISIERVGN